MKVYLAAYYGLQEQMRAVREELVEVGHSVTSRWIDQSISRATPAQLRAEPEQYRQYARIDLDDINEADVLACFCTPRYPSVGRHVEFGVAYAWGMQCVIVGARETPFHVLEDVMHFSTSAGFIEHMRGVA